MQYTEFSVTTLESNAAHHAEKLSKVARYALVSTARPLFINGLSLAEHIHKALVEHACKLRGHGNAPPVFTGHSGNGETLEGHQHVHILFEANDMSSPGVTHITLYAPMGFTADDRQVLERLRTLYNAGGHDRQLVLLGVGDPEDFGGPAAAGRCPLLARSSVWLSRTPFVPTRHLKTYQDGTPKLDARGLPVGGPEHDLLRLVREQGFPAPVVAPLATATVGSRDVEWHRFSTERYSGGGRRGSRRGYGYRLEFPRPVQGPMVLGFGAHFGLGVFGPE